MNKRMVAYFVGSVLRIEAALMLLPLLDCALAVYNKAHRFDEIALERYRPL